MCCRIGRKSHRGSESKEVVSEVVSKVVSEEVGAEVGSEVDAKVVSEVGAEVGSDKHNGGHSRCSRFRMSTLRALRPGRRRRIALEFQ